jgi:hypothetical protein
VPAEHGVDDDGMLHAYRNPIRTVQLDDLVMLIGADASGGMLEVGVAQAEGVAFILHAVPARPRFVR